MRKTRQIKRGVLIFAAAVATVVTSVPAYAVENDPAIYDLAKEEVNLTYNQDALNLLQYCDKEELKTWDQSLAPMTDGQAQEIKAFVENDIVQGETDDYKRQDLFITGL